MRKTISFLALLSISLMCYNVSFAQENYNRDYKYRFFSNWSLGVAGTTYKTTDFNNWTIGDGVTFGPELRLNKRIGKRWDYRIGIETPGLVTYAIRGESKFDQYAKITSGVSLNFLDFAYLFADAGIAVDPDKGSTIKDKFDAVVDGKGLDPVFQAGIGFNVDFGKNDYNTVFVELGADTRTHYANNDFEWKPNLFGKIGYSRCLGVTQKDKMKLAELESYPEKIHVLEHENALLKDETIRCGVTNSELAQAINKTTTLCNKLEKELEDCRTSKPENNETVNTFFQIFFGYADCTINELENDKLEMIAKHIKESNCKYVIEGFSSVPGSDEFNKQLSNKRANAVYNKLIELGAGDNIESVTGFGKTEKFGNGNSINQTVTINKK